MKNLYSKLAKAKQHIKTNPTKKAGRNKFSNYDYFTPEQVESLVFEACQDAKLITLFNLKRNEFGEYGELTVADIESDDSIVVTMATAIPDIKATNISQQIGGCMTYTERYLKMSIFGITENGLDPDTTENTKKTVESAALSKLIPLKVNDANWKKVKAYCESQKGQDVDSVVANLSKKYEITPAVEKEIAKIVG